MSDHPKTIVRRGNVPDSVSKPVVTPIYPSVVYASPDADALDAQYEGVASGYTYAREGHPNADVLARKIDSLENAEGGLITSSGMSALSAIYLGLLQAGDHIVAGDQLYGRNLRLLTEDLPRLGFSASLCDPTDVNAVAAAIRPETRMILVEALSNPTLRVADMEGIAALARDRGVLLVVDNTFTTPSMYRPLDAGADIVMHSVTKLLSGHSDVMLGYVAARDPAHRQAMLDAVVTWGLTPSPFDCWLAERGMQSFHLRFARAQENAAALADAIAPLEGVEAVLYPTRSDHPDHNRAAGLFDGTSGNMLSFRLRGGRDQVNRFIRATQGIPFAPTLGDIGTTLSHPASSSHRALSPDARAKLGITEAFFRVSVGVEDIDILREEFIRGIKAAMS